jgi:hypothetical protein
MMNTVMYNETFPSFSFPLVTVKIFLHYSFLCYIKCLSVIKDCLTLKAKVLLGVSMTVDGV